MFIIIDFFHALFTVFNSFLTSILFFITVFSVFKFMLEYLLLPLAASLL